MPKYKNVEPILAKLEEFAQSTCDSSYEDGIRIAMQVMNEKPIADVQEVTKCKDCVYATYMLLHRGDKPVIWRCERMQCRLFDENSYCSWARRKAQPIRKEQSNDGLSEQEAPKAEC